MTPHRPVAAMALAVASILLVGCTALGGASTPTPTGVPESNVLDLDVGDCLVTGGAGRVTKTVPVVDCSLEHDSEAYANITVAGISFPGDDAISEQAVAECTTEFTTFIGMDYEKSSLDFAYYYPTQSSWERGDHEILCLAIDPETESVTGSLAGSAR